MKNKTKYVDTLVTIAYYWLSEENYNCAVSIYKLIKKLNLNNKEEKRAEDLKSDIITMSKNKDIISSIEEIKIPERYVSEEDKLLWIIITTIMNFFNSGNFELGFVFLKEISEEWHEIYINVISALQKSDFKEEIIDWAMTYFFFAHDIVGKNNFNSLGYKITKI